MKCDILVTYIFELEEEEVREIKNFLNQFGDKSKIPKPVKVFLVALRELLQEK